MTKKETIWRHILVQATQAKAKKQRLFTQKAVAGKFHFSTSTVFNALKAPRKMGAIEVTGRYFRLRDFEKLLLLWATQRNLEKDIVYKTSVNAPPRDIEGSMPPGVIFAGWSAYRLSYKDAPADYDTIYVYSSSLTAIKKRFPPKKGFPNLVILKPDPDLVSFGQTTPDAQTFVDLWNMKQWYAKDYLTALKKKLKFN